MTHAARVTIETSDGRRITGAVQGAGGPLTARIARRELQRAIERAADSRPLGRVYEPIPGHCCVMPDYSASDDGIRMAVDLNGARIVGVSS